MSFKNSRNNLSQPVVAGPAEIEYPFAGEGDYGHLIIKQPYFQIPEYYRPMRLDTGFSSSYCELQSIPHQAFSTFLVRETQPQNQGAGVGMFERWFANVPYDRITPRRITWLRPGIDGEGSAEGSSIVSVGNFRLFAADFTLSSIIGFDLDDIVTIFGYYQDPSTGNQGNYHASGRILTVTGNTLRVALSTADIQRVAGGTVISIQSTGGGSPSRLSQAINITARVMHTYFQSANPWDMQLPQKFRIFDADGNETDTLSDDTTPTEEKFFGQEIDAENAEGPERYMGNIWAIRRIVVTAQ